MDTTQLKQNFENQLSEIDDKITKIEEELSKAKEYKLKLQGGLETLELLSKEPEEIPMPEIEVMEEDK
jgi:peptidoglycan hydrolase CwlO-like protein